MDLGRDNGERFPNGSVLGFVSLLAMAKQRRVTDPPKNVSEKSSYNPLFRLFCAFQLVQNELAVYCAIPSIGTHVISTRSLDIFSFFVCFPNHFTPNRCCRPFRFGQKEKFCEQIFHKWVSTSTLFSTRSKHPKLWRSTRRSYKNIHRAKKLVLG